MGVLGFTPFLQKQFPEVFRELPQRLRSLSGKTIAIDGTLITQRLHFAPIPYENRHILGWYNLVRELKECGVGVICVFDGEERSHAKKLETERRKRAHRMDIARGAMEIERSRRLRRLTTLLKQYRALPEPVKECATKTLQSMVLTSEEIRGIPEPSRETVLNTDASALSLCDELLPQESSPSTSQTGIPTRTVVLPGGRVSTPIPSRNLSEESQVPTDPSSLNITFRDQNLDTSLRTLEDILPKYFEDEDEAKATEPQKTYDSSSIQPNDRVSSEEDYFLKTFPPSSHQVVLNNASSSTVLAREEHVPQQTKEQFEPSNDVVNSSNAPAAPAEDMKPSCTAETARQDIQSADSRDDNSLKFSAKILEPVQAFIEEAPLLSDPEFNEIFDEESRLDVQADSLASKLDVSSTDIAIVEAEPPAEAISQGLISLYQDYQESIPTFMSPPTLEPSAEVSIMTEVHVGVQDQYIMSRNQIQLTLDEGNLWNTLARTDIPYLENTESTLMEEKLESLAQKSDVITRSYEKRNNPPTQKTYDECKLILRAMGVPCIESVGAYEAEALAASLVHNGFADYVASEDTDVLVYEAPLLRGLANRQSPLTLLSGTEVRQALQLDRASYVDFALLLGTDFSQRIKNLGPQRAIKLIRTHGRIEHVIANEPKFVPRMPTDVYLKQVEVARLVFETLPPLPDPESLLPTESDDEAVIAILEKFGVYRAAAVDWDFASALDGNYFDDNPAVA